MTMTKTPLLSRERALNILYDFYHHLQGWISSGKPPVQAEVEKYLSPNFRITSNGSLIGKTAADYLARVKKFQEKYSRFEFSKPLEEPILNGNEMAIYYRLDLTPRKGGAPRQIFILATATFDENHITRWTQVTHERGSNEWDR